MKKLVSLTLALLLLLSLAVGVGTAYAEPELTCAVDYIVPKSGIVYLTVKPGELLAAGFSEGDIVTVSVNGYTLDMQIMTQITNAVPWGTLVLWVQEDSVSLVARSAFFSAASELTHFDEEGMTVWNDSIEQPVSVTLKWKNKNDYAGQAGIKLGVLTPLDLDEEQLEKFYGAQYMASYFSWLAHPEVSDGNHFKRLSQDINEVVYYDTLDALLMGLNAGEVDMIAVTESVAQYLLATNEQIERNPLFAVVPEDDTSVEGILYNSSIDDYSFMLLEENTALRDEINAVLGEMRADGTLDDLMERYISGANMMELTLVEIESFDGAETLRVAVTGDLPPMDYIREDGTPAGFSTAVLAEIGKRMRKNVELVQVSNVGRALALSTGQVDAVFWTRNRGAKSYTDLLNVYEGDLGKTNLESKMMTFIVNFRFPHFSVRGFLKGDIPEGIITTDSYFSDLDVFVSLKTE